MRTIISIYLVIILSALAFAVDSLDIAALADIELAPLRGVDVDGGYIFAFAKAPKLYSLEYVCGGGLFVLDSIVWDGFTMPSGTHLTGRWIDCADGRAFVADWTSGIRVFDISDPFDIVEDTAFVPAGQVRSVYANGDTLFAAANASGVHVYDISGDLDYITTLDIGSAVLDVAGRPDGNVLVAEDGADFSVWDLADPSDPISWETFPGDAIRLIDYDTQSLIADWSEGIVLIDIYDITDPFEIATIDYWDSDVFDLEIWQDNHIIIGVGFEGVSIVDLGSGAIIAEVGYYIPDDANIIDVQTNSAIAYAADAGGMLYALDLADLASIAERALPETPELRAYPNPFNSSVKISVSVIPGLIRPYGSSENPEIEIFDINGHLIDVIARRAEPDAAISSNNRSGVSLNTRRDAVSNKTDCHALRTRNDDKGEYIWTPDESLGSGVYLVRIGLTKSTIKIIYMK